jgi:hypothetical protein
MKRFFSIQNTIIFICFPIVGCILIYYYQYELNPDGISYLSIAKKYSEGDFKDAVNGHWSPMISWLLIPFILLNINSIVAAKIISVITGVGVLYGLKLLCGLYISDKIIKIFFIAIASVIILPFCFLMTSPDLLVVCFLIYYVYFLLSKDYSTKKNAGLLCGVTGVIAYLSKSYVFFFFIIHFSIVNFLYYWKADDRLVRQSIRNNFARGMLIFLCICSIWITALSFKYHHFTVSTAGQYNFKFIGKASGGEHKINSGFLPLPNPTAVSAWEDPSYLHYPSWNPFSSYENFRHLGATIYYNIVRIYETFFGYSPLCIGIVFISLIIIISYKDSKMIAGSDLSLLLFTAILYLSGYALLVVLERYLWFSYLLVLLLGIILLDKLFGAYEISPAKKVLILFLLGLHFIISPARAVIENRNMDKGMYDLSVLLKSNYNIKGNIASDNYWFNTLFLSYHCGWSYYGKPAENISNEKLLSDLKKFNINYYLVWNNTPESRTLLSSYKEITNGKLPGLKIYLIK